jgi:hypothetical protein
MHRPLVGVLYLPRYLAHWLRYRRLCVDRKPSLIESYPCLTDWTTHTPFDPHYFYQGAWLARRLVECKPTLHVDIASSVMTIGILSATVETVFVDYRPLRAQLAGLTSVAGNVLSLPFTSGSLASLSCLHVIEHVGLGRYGDPIDPEGCDKAAHELQRVLKPEGRLYLAVPVGRDRICFNAHRVCAPEYIVELFAPLLMQEFSYVNDAGVFLEHGLLGDAANSEYACGMFVFTKSMGDSYVFQAPREEA